MNTSNANAIALDEVGLAPGQILTDGVRQWRPNCQEGQFIVGQVQQGAALEMEIVAAADYFGRLFPKYPAMWWTGVLFVDSSGSLSSILLKTESRENFFELHRSQKLAGATLLGQVVRAKMAKRSGSKGKYYALEFSLSDKPAQYAAAIADFRGKTNFQEMLQFSEVPADESDSKAMATA